MGRTELAHDVAGDRYSLGAAEARQRLNIGVCLLALLFVSTATYRADAATAAAQHCVKPSIEGMIVAIDRNKDGKLSHDEWRAQGLPESSFAGLSKGHGYVLPADWRAGDPPPGIDANGDCVITLDEFRAFDKKKSALMKKGPK